MTAPETGPVEDDGSTRAEGNLVVTCGSWTAPCGGAGSMSLPNPATRGLTGGTTSADGLMSLPNPATRGLTGGTTSADGLMSLPNPATRGLTGGTTSADGLMSLPN